MAWRSDVPFPVQSIGNEPHAKRPACAMPKRQPSSLHVYLFHSYSCRSRRWRFYPWRGHSEIQPQATAFDTLKTNILAVSPRASANRIFANQLAKNKKRFKLEFSHPSHSVQLQKDKSCYQASQKLGKIHGIFEVQTCLESCPTFGRFRRCHHYLTVWLELFSKLTRTAVNHSFAARHSHPKRAKGEVQQEDRNPHGDQVNLRFSGCGEYLRQPSDYHLQWTPSLGRMQDKVWRDGAQTDLETPVSALFASPRNPWASRAKYASSEESHYAEGLPAPFAPQTSLLHKRLGKRLGRFQNICLLVTANDTAKAVRTAFAIKAAVTNKQIWNLLLHGHNTSYTGRAVPGSLPSGKRKFRQVKIRCEIPWSFNRSSMLSLHH